jgi:hypothetical protein
MKLDFKKIINIKNKQDLKEYPLDKPIFQNNYLFHYLIQLGNLTALKLTKFPIHIENNDGLNGFHLAAKEYNHDILLYLIETYPDYIYNRNGEREAFTNYLPWEEFNKIIEKFPKLDWVNLIENGNKNPNIILKGILINLNYNQVQKFIKLYQVKPTKEFKNQYLFSILKNPHITSEQKIKILDEFTDEELNVKNDAGEGIILNSLEHKDIALTDYLLKRNVDINYHSFLKTDNALIMAVYNDILNNQFVFTGKILSKLKEINPQFHRANNKYGDNIAHTICYIRKNRNNQIKMAVEVKNQNYKPDLEVLNLCDSETWNSYNIEKLTPLDLITNLDYQIYSPIILKNKISIDQNIISRLEKDSVTKMDWIKLFKSLPQFKEDNDVKMEQETYSHYTLFQAKFKDVGIFSLYLSDTYKNLLIPNMTSYMINNITFDDTFPFSDDIISKEPIFPWIISYYSASEYYIHPYLNNIINATRREGDKDYALVFLSLIYDKILHANILIYDFKKMTVERFEPYGNTSLIDNTVDDVLEEELTWSTGLKYIRPNEYLPYAGFQTISDEGNYLNKKAGDFGGFCLAWCLWYLETKIKNPNVDSKTLINKLIHKLSKSDIKFSEHIRNYSNRINEKRVKYLEKIGLDIKSISNTHMSLETDIKLTNFFINKFNGLDK